MTKHYCDCCERDIPSIGQKKLRLRTFNPIVEFTAELCDACYNQLLNVTLTEFGKAVARAENEKAARKKAREKANDES